MIMPGGIAKIAIHISGISNAFVEKFRGIVADLIAIDGVLYMMGHAPHI
jgi:hypothetical protein